MPALRHPLSRFRGVWQYVALDDGDRSIEVSQNTGDKQTSHSCSQYQGLVAQLRHNAYFSDLPPRQQVNVSIASTCSHFTGNGRRERGGVLAAKRKTGVGSCMPLRSYTASNARIQSGWPVNI